MILIDYHFSRFRTLFSKIIRNIMIPINMVINTEITAYSFPEFLSESDALSAIVCAERIRGNSDIINEANFFMCFLLKFILLFFNF